MPIPTNFETLLSREVVESERIEFKRRWDPEASLKTICAFANDIENIGGGYMVIGVAESADNNLELVGIPQNEVDATLKSILNATKKISPDYAPLSQVVFHEGKHFVVLWCHGGMVRPYSCPKHPNAKKSERTYYIRKYASTIEATEDEKRELYQLSNNVPFDDCIQHGARLSDLDKDLVLQYLHRVGSKLEDLADGMPFEELCRCMDIVAGPPEYLRPKNVGLLFFSSQPERFLPYSWIDVVEFPEGLGGDRIIEHSFKGRLDRQLDATLEYLQDNVIAEKVVKHEDRFTSDRFVSYPTLALREALANAVYHKGYDIREPIEVRVLPDRIEILSFPGADRSISAEALMKFQAISRRYRNRRIGEFLKELHFTEGRNTGFHRILRALRVNGSPEPLFETDEDRLYFLTTIFIHPEFLDPMTPRTELYLMEKDRPPLLVASCERQADQREKAIVAYFKEHPSASIAQLCADLGFAPATANRSIKKLKEDNVLVRIGARKNGTWEVRS